MEIILHLYYVAQFPADFLFYGTNPKIHPFLQVLPENFLKLEQAAMPIF